MGWSPVLKGSHENKTYFNLLATWSFSLCSLSIFDYAISNRLAVMSVREPQTQWSEVGKHQRARNMSISC